MVFRLLLAPLLLLAHELVLAQTATPRQTTAAPGTAAAPATNRKLAAPGRDYPAQHIPNRIDSLITDEQVINFIKTQTSFSGHLSLHPDSPAFNTQWNYQAKLDSFGAQPYEKADFDANNHTDLLLNAFIQDPHDKSLCTLVVLAFDNDSFAIRSFSDWRSFSFQAAKTIRIRGRDCIHLLHINPNKHRSRVNNSPTQPIWDYRQYSDTLVCFDKNFIELTHPAPHHVEKVQYLLFPSEPFGRQTISGDALRSKKEFASLNRLLKRLDFPHLYNHYSITATDQPECTLEITYDHGKKKKIEDWGMNGTLGLEALYQILWNLHQVHPPDIPLP